MDSVVPNTSDSVQFPPLLPSDTTQCAFSSRWSLEVSVLLRESCGEAVKHVEKVFVLVINVLFQPETSPVDEEATGLVFPYDSALSEALVVSLIGM